MQTSFIRSAISLDDSQRHESRETSLAQSELALEINRLQRRNALLSKSKQVLQEELQLYKQEIYSKDRRIQQLTLKINKISFSAGGSQSERSQGKEYSHLQVIFFQKQEQLNLIGEALAEKARLLSELTLQNEQLRGEVESKNNTIQQIKESSRAQLSYQKTLLQHLQQEVQQKTAEMASGKIFYQNLVQKEAIRWQKTHQNLKERLRMAQEQSNSIILEQSRYQQQKLALKEKNQELSHEISELSQKISWLKALLEQAKGQFINVQLKQQQQLEKEQKEKLEYRQRNKLLKMQLKNLKMEGEGANTSTCIPSNKSIRTASTVTITPFRMNSGRSRFSGSNEQD